MPLFLLLFLFPLRRSALVMCAVDSALQMRGLSALSARVRVLPRVFQSVASKLNPVVLNALNSAVVSAMSVKKCLAKNVKILR